MAGGEGSEGAPQPFDAVAVAALYGNRAASHVMILAYEQAIADCDSAVQLNPKFANAIFRKAMALKKLVRACRALRSFPLRPFFFFMFLLVSSLVLFPSCCFFSLAPSLLDETHRVEIRRITPAFAGASVCGRAPKNAIFFRTNTNTSRPGCNSTLQPCTVCVACARCGHVLLTLCATWFQRYLHGLAAPGHGRMVWGTPSLLLPL